MVGQREHVGEHSRKALYLLKRAAVEELKRKGLASYIPGVSIIVGLAEDSVAAWQAIQLVDSGNTEIRGIVANLDRKISEATWQLTVICTKRAEILGLIQAIERTA